MSTPAQALANQNNAQFSTGPQTPEGKAAASRNAATHGLSNSAFTLLPTEDLEAFHDEQECYYERFNPQDHHEVFLIHLAVQSTWKLARLNRIQAHLFKIAINPEIAISTPEAAIALGMYKSNPNAFITLERYAAAAQRTYFKAIREMEKIVAARPTPPPQLPVLPYVAPPRPTAPPKIPNKANFAPASPAPSPNLPEYKSGYESRTPPGR